MEILSTPALFRHPGPVDLPALLGLMRAFYREEGLVWNELAATRALHVMLARPGEGTLWLAAARGKAVGYLAVTYGYSLEHGGRDAFVDEIYVAPRWRHRGIARHVLGLAEDHCRRHGAYALHLVVRRKNRRAQRLYQRHGFSGTERILMSKPLRCGPVVCESGVR